ncbi:hypothetical protein PROFUN_16809, partial [Planoprotostelium fungivorum]
MSRPKKQFLGCVAKHAPPEVFQKCVEQYDDPDAQYEQYKIIPYSGLRNSAYEKELNADRHLLNGIREYVSRNPADFKDYLDEISAGTKYLSTISRLVKKENGPDARNRIRRRILQAAENSGDVTDEEHLVRDLINWTKLRSTTRGPGDTATKNIENKRLGLTVRGTNIRLPACKQDLRKQDEMRIIIVTLHVCNSEAIMRQFALLFFELSQGENNKDHMM